MPQSLRSPRLRQRRRRRIAVKVILLAGIPLVLITGLVFLARADFLQVQKIDIPSSGVLTADDILPIAEEKLEGNYVWLIPRRNIILFPAQEIEQALLTTFPRIESVDVSPKGLRDIAIRITEREPEALWCDGEGECYFLDAKGFIFASAPKFSDPLYLSFTGTIEGEALGSSVLSETEFTDVLTFVEGVRETGLSPVSVASLGAREYELALLHGEVILFTTLEPVAETVLNLKTVLDDPELDLARPNGLSVSQLDLRYGNKVFYKRKGGI